MRKVAKSRISQGESSSFARKRALYPPLYPFKCKSPDIQLLDTMNFNWAVHWVRLQHSDDHVGQYCLLDETLVCKGTHRIIIRKSDSIQKRFQGS